MSLLSTFLPKLKSKKEYDEFDPLKSNGSGPELTVSTAHHSVAWRLIQSLK